jgi:hypothetical protein
MATDGPNVNLKFYKELHELLGKCEDGTLSMMNTGTCPIALKNMYNCKMWFVGHYSFWNLPMTFQRRDHPAHCTQSLQYFHWNSALSPVGREFASLETNDQCVTVSTKIHGSSEE